jgi:DNA-binding transcriptional LysR family regulator
MTLLGQPRDSKLDIDLQSLRIVRAISETGSITGASRLLGYSQPAISQHLQRAESRLGMPLVVRLGRTVRLTEAGQILSRHSTTVMAALQDAANELDGLADLRAGRVRLAAFPSASSTLVPRLLSTLRDTRPGLSVQYLEAEPPEAIAMLRRGDCDLAFTFSYPGDPEDPHGDSAAGLAVTSLFTDPMMLILPSDHPLAGESVVNLSELEDDTWIAGCPRCRGHLLSVCENVGFAPTISYETDNFVAVLGMVASGLGVALLPRLALGTASVPRGAVVRRAAPHSDRTIHLLTLAESQPTPALFAIASAAARIDGAAWRLGRA